MLQNQNSMFANILTRLRTLKDSSQSVLPGTLIHQGALVRNAWYPNEEIKLENGFTSK